MVRISTLSNQIKQALVVDHGRALRLRKPLTESLSVVEDRFRFLQVNLVLSDFLRDLDIFFQLNFDFSVSLVTLL